MNIGSLLQYQRDTWEDSTANGAVVRMQEILVDTLNPKTGYWGDYDTSNPVDRSRMIQFAYHLFPILLYDQYALAAHPDWLKPLFDAQNRYGGFGVQLNSSACEDIDTIDLLYRMAPLFPDDRERIDEVLSNALRWVLTNQRRDGGFVFRLGERLTYGHVQMYTNFGESGLFPSWFRTLSLAYLFDHFKISGLHLINAPGTTFTNRFKCPINDASTPS